MLRESHGFKLHEAARIAARLTLELRTLCGAWREIHGHYH